MGVPAAAVAGLLFLLAVGAVARRLAPESNTGNTGLSRFDTLIVLGVNADADGNPTPEQLALVTEAVREYEQGVAPRIIFSGAAVANRFVEAQVMASTAEAQGIPAAAISMEPQARDTIQNACYSTRIMKAHGWQSAEVIANPVHVARSGLIFSHLPLEWRLHAAPPLAPVSGMTVLAYGLLEDLKTARYVLWARHTEHCTP